MRVPPHPHHGSRRARIAPCTTPRWSPTPVHAVPQPSPWGPPTSPCKGPHTPLKSHHRRAPHITEEVKIVAARRPCSIGERTTTSVLLRPRSDHLGHGSPAKPDEDATHGRGSTKLPATEEEHLEREHPAAAAILAGRPGCAGGTLRWRRGEGRGWEGNGDG
jgi:hypothetical protein